MVESGKTTLSSQFVQVPDMPTNFHRHSTSRSTELAKALDLPSSPKESRSSPDLVRLSQSRICNIYLFYPPSFIPIFRSKCFPRFPVFPSNSPQFHQIWSGFKVRGLRHELLLNMKFNLRSNHPFVSKNT